MFKPNTLNKLYPHLNFGRIPPPSATVSQNPIQQRSTSVHSVKSNTSERNQVITNTPPPTPVVTATETPKTEVKEKRVKIRPEPIENAKHIEQVKTIELPKIESPKKAEEPIKVEPAQERVKVKRPNRAKPEPKPEPVRETQVPVKGERGLQLKYTTEQRKQIYLDRLSRKSIKNAEKEIARVNEVLESVEHNPERLKAAEKEVKQRLRLINYAKYFTECEASKCKASSINEGATKTKPINDLPKKSERPKVSKKSDDGQHSTPISGSGRGRGGDSERDSESDATTSSDSEATEA